MGLKRKRSVDSSPLSISSFGTAPTPEAQSPCPIPDNYDFTMDLDTSPHSILFSRSWDARLSGSEMGSRTRKRFRDNRPDERVIHGTSYSYKIGIGVWFSDDGSHREYN